MRTIQYVNAGALILGIAALIFSRPLTVVAEGGNPAAWAPANANPVPTPAVLHPGADGENRTLTNGQLNSGGPASRPIGTPTQAQAPNVYRDPAVQPATHLEAAPVLPVSPASKTKSFGEHGAGSLPGIVTMVFSLGVV